MNGSKVNQRNVLYENYAQLVGVLETRSDLLEHFLSEGCLTPAHVEDIQSEVTSDGRNRKLIGIILRASVLKLQKAIACFIKSNQSHVVRLILGDEGWPSFCNVECLPFWADPCGTVFCKVIHVKG